MSSDLTVSVGEIRLPDLPTMDAGGDVGDETFLAPCSDDAEPFLVVSILGKGYSPRGTEEGLCGLSCVGLRGDENTEGGLGLVLTSGLNFNLVI